MLDLGVWASIQSFVERLHRGRRTQVSSLVNTIENAWSIMDSSSFTNVHLRWERVLKLVIADNGGNAKVDQQRKKLLKAVVTAENAELPSLYAPSNNNTAQQQ